MDEIMDFEQPDRYSLPDDLIKELVNEPTLADEVGNPVAGRVRPVSETTINLVVESQRLSDIENLAGSPKQVARELFRGLFYETRVSRSPKGSAHDAVIYMLTQESGRLPNDEY